MRPDSDGDRDVITAGNGDNLVFGDNGQITAAASDDDRFGTLGITLGLVETIESLIGGSDQITTGIGNDIVLGGIDADTIYANFVGLDGNDDPILSATDGNNIVIGDSGYIDWTANDTGRFYAADTPLAGTLSGDDTLADDIDRAFSTEPDHGGNDTITTGDGDDLIIGGEDGEIVTDVEIEGVVTTTRTVEADSDGDRDVITAGNGDNLVFGDNGQITAAASDDDRFGTLGITLGLVETIESLIGGSDQITSGIGNDIVLGGIDADTIYANFVGLDTNDEPVLSATDGNNIVIGDSGYIDWTANDTGRFYAADTPLAGTLSGDDTGADDIDRAFSTEPDHGGNDIITTGDGDDLIIGGEDGEIVTDVEIEGVVTLTRTVAADTDGDGDHITAGNGDNLVLGDNGQITAATSNDDRFGSLGITLGLVETIDVVDRRIR